jgi:UDP-glucuronate 4-epimerase
MIILLTGSAGFIGFHTAKRLLDEGHTVIGVDNFNAYYDPRIKEDRTAILARHKDFHLYRGDLENLELIKEIFGAWPIDKVCHLAAQAGVRYSLVNPYAYIQSNIVGFAHVLHEAKEAGVQHFVYASSSSVYGDQEEIPFHEEQMTDKPLSLYAATKKADELIAHAYHATFGMQCTGLRFFTVYGPYSRPDMAMIGFAQAIQRGERIQLFNQGNMLRDFTYVDDIVDGIMKSLETPFGYEILNLGNGNPVPVKTLVELLEAGLEERALIEYAAMSPGESATTYADTKKAQTLLDWSPKTNLAEGVSLFLSWYRSYY